MKKQHEGNFDMMINVMYGFPQPNFYQTIINHRAKGLFEEMNNLGT